MFPDIEAKTKEMNQKANEIEEHMERVEDFLIEVSAGVDARSGDLSFMRGPGGFRLMVHIDDTTKPWRDSSRDLRLQTASSLPDLIHEIEKQIDQKIQKSNEVLEYVLGYDTSTVEGE